MTDYTNVFELVLYYERRAVVKPSEPTYEEIQKNNPALETDDLLDLYNDLIKRHKEDMKIYEKTKNDSVVTEFVRIPEDETFIERVKSIEKEPYFIEWEKTSKKLIDSTFVKLLKK